MGNTMVARVLSKSQAPSQARFVLTILAHHADDTGYCYPSVRRLSQMSGLSERQVQYHLRTLERLNEIRVSVGTGPHGCNEYFIFEAPVEVTPQSIAPRMKSTGAINGNHPVQSIAPESKEESNIATEVAPERLRRFLTPGSRVHRLLTEPEEHPSIEASDDVTSTVKPTPIEESSFVSVALGPLH